MDQFWLGVGIGVACALAAVEVLDRVAEWVVPPERDRTPGVLVVWPRREAVAGERSRREIYHSDN